MSTNALVFWVAATFVALLVAVLVGFYLVTPEEGCTTRDGVELCEVDYARALAAGVGTFLALSVVNTMIALLISINDRIGAIRN